MSMVPALIMSLIMWAACWPEPHCASTIVPPVCWASPACSQARRTMPLDCSPAWVTQPADDLVDQLGVEPGAGEDLTHRMADEHGRVHAGQPALPLAEGSADGVDDDRSTHGTKLEHVLVSHNLP